VATNQDLKHDSSEGKFRHDLYYRVNVLQIHSPDLLTVLEHYSWPGNVRNWKTLWRRRDVMVDLENVDRVIEPLTASQHVVTVSTIHGLQLLSSDALRSGHAINDQAII